MNVLSIVSSLISLLSLVVATIAIVRLFHRDTKSDSKTDAYRQGKLDEKLNNILSEIKEIKEQLSIYDKNLTDFKKEVLEDVNLKIGEAIKTHEAIYHNKKEQK